MTTQPSLGIWRATSLVVGNIIGAGIFMLPASLAMYGNVGLLGLIVTATGALLLAKVFARLSRDFPVLGGPYAYSREAFGEFIGFQMAWMYWIGTWASVAAITIGFVSYLGVFWPALHDNVGLTFLISVATVWLFTFINMIGVKTASTVQLITTILKIVPLSIIGIVGLKEINFQNLLVLNAHDVPFWPSVSAAAALTLFSFIGLESATIPAEDVKNPRKTIPKATVLGTLLSAIIYIGTMAVVFGILTPEQLASSKAPFVDAGSYIFGSWAGPVVAISAILCCLSTVNGWILVQSQMPVAIARDKLFPDFFDKHTKNGSPWVALLVSASLISLLLFMNFEAGLREQFTTIVFFTTFTVILTYLYSATAELYLLFMNPKQIKTGKFARILIVSLLAYGYMMLILIGSGPKATFLGMLFVFSGFPVYVFMKRSHTKLNVTRAIK